MQREIDGVLLIDKPEGITSAGVVRELKRRLHPRKIGHGGTLDPMATGLLVILLGRATKLSSRFLDGDKVYSGTIRLGVGTDTDDMSGAVTETDPQIGERFPESRRAELQAQLVTTFSGEMSQVPPSYSAIKVNGKRSYDLARKGEAPVLEPRAVKISELALEFTAPDRLRYFMRCSKGTYVRSFARDIGRFLRTCGAVETLCREACGGLTLDRAIPLAEVSEDTYLNGFLRASDLGDQNTSKSLQ